MVIETYTILEKLQRHLLCKPYENSISTNLKPRGKLQKAIISALQLERSKFHNIIISYPKKALRVYDAEDILSWFGLKDGYDILMYPSTTFLYPSDCDMYSNTVLAYLIPVLDISQTDIKIKKPNIDYILTVEDLIESIKEHIAGKFAKIYVLSKYARPGNLYSFINKLSAKKVELYIASEAIRRKYKEESNNTWVVGTTSHRKLLLVVTHENNDDFVFIGYRGSMNIFFPGVDDYLEAVTDWDDMKRLLHGLFRAFLIF